MNKISGVILAGFITYMLLIWVPYFQYFRVAFPEAPNAMDIEKSRYFPESSALLAALEIDDPAPKFENAIDAKLHLNFSSSGPSHRHSTPLIPFTLEQTNMGTTSTKLAIHSLGVVHHLISEFKKTKSEKQLGQAIDYLLDYANWDRDNRFSNSFNNNDHAVASRAFALVKVWIHYRQQQNYSPLIGRSLTEYAGYLAVKLKKQGFYTYYSNHGSMQNLGLMLLGSTFRHYTDSATWFDVGYRRLEEQLGYLLSEDGFFLEHSFGYQVFFTDILRTADALVEGFDNAESAKIKTGFHKANTLLKTMKRDNGSLPPIGDTASLSGLEGKHDLATQVTATSEILFFPNAGIAKMIQPSALNQCGNKVSSLTTVWGNFADHAHYRANEGAVDVFACGTQWWRSSGYVPYWHFARESAESWLGDNAAHLVSESKAQPYTSHPYRLHQSAELNFFQINRDVPTKNAAIARQIYQFGSVIVIKDSLSTDIEALEGNQMNTYWTMAHDKIMSEGEADNSFVFKSQRSGSTVYLYSRFLSSAPLQINTLRGDSNSVLGWVQDDGQMKPADTLFIKPVDESEHPLVNVSVLLDNNRAPCEPDIQLSQVEQNRGDFTVDIFGCGLSYKLWHGDDVIQLNDHQSNTTSMTTRPDTQYLRNWHLIETNTQAAKQKYGPRFRPLFEYRVKASVFGLVMFAATFMALHLLGRYRLMQRYSQWFAVVLWVALPCWLKLIYFSS